MKAPMSGLSGSDPRVLLNLTYPAMFRPRTLSTRIIASKVRSASTTAKGNAADPSKPIRLEQPTKFVPPSHPSRKNGWSMPKSYGAKWTETEREQSSQRHYPGLMAPRGTWAYWFWHSRAIHLCITLVCSTCCINCQLRKKLTPIQTGHPSFPRYLNHDP